MEPIATYPWAVTVLLGLLVLLLVAAVAPTTGAYRRVKAEADQLRRDVERLKLERLRWTR